MTHPVRTDISQSVKRLARRSWLATAVGACGLSLPAYLQLRASPAHSTSPKTKAKSCIILYCWGGMSHHETWDTTPDAPKDLTLTLPIPSACS
jgi:hypothetical protein